jgi:hypothetical protein
MTQLVQEQQEQHHAEIDEKKDEDEVCKKQSNGDDNDETTYDEQRSAQLETKCQEKVIHRSNDKANNNNDNKSSNVVVDDERSLGSTANVSFASVQVREYERVIDPSMYMGLTLGWNYWENPPCPIPVISKPTGSFDKDDKEAAARASRKHQGQRFQTFLEYGFTRKELKAITAETAKIMKQRQREDARRLIVEENHQKQQHQASSSASTKKAPERRFLRSLFR